MQTILETIQSPLDLKKLSMPNLLALADELRERIIDVLSTKGGHLASNLGIIELTVALHYVFDSPHDKFIFDVSHQTYTHKILTGRNAQFPTIRQFEGLSGFSNPKESIHDHFYAGHAGTALSLALGLAKRRDLLKSDEYIIAVLGDGALTCGLTLEALNNIPKDLKNFIIILNDNAMSISKNVGAITQILSRFVNHPTSNKIYQEVENLLGKIPGYGSTLAKQGHKVRESLKNLVSTAPFFEQYGLSYVGPIPGHDLKKLVDILESIKTSPSPSLLHAITVKGQGLETAILNPTSYHGAKPFNPKTGHFLPAGPMQATFPNIFGEQMLSMANHDPNLIVLTPAMPAGSCLEPLMQTYPTRCIDVGIAEGHCVTFAGGIAFGGQMRVVVCIYATFLQRAFDNLFHDICLQELPVIFALDRGGLAGGDGATHNGIYDLGFLLAMPNMVIAQPRNGILLRELFSNAFTWNKPVAIRYPNLPTVDSTIFSQDRPLGKGEILHQGEKIAIIALGHMCSVAIEVKDFFKKEGLDITIVDPIFIKPLDEALMETILSSHELVVTLEEHSAQVGLSTVINGFAIKRNHTSPILNIGIPEIFVEQGTHKLLHKEIGLDASQVFQNIKQVLIQNGIDIGVLI